jgi:hypothetical protein
LLLALDIAVTVEHVEVVMLPYAGDARDVGAAEDKLH